MNRSFGLTLAGIVLLSVATTDAGGWAVITVEDLPDEVVAGQPVTLTFTVRQHGRVLVPGLTPQVEARAGALQARAVTTPSERSGEYTATVTLPQPADWTVTIHSGYGASSLTLLPLKAVEATSDDTLSHVPDVARGRRLFVAKGCITCHRHDAAGRPALASIGPALTDRRYGAVFLREFLADPTIARVARRDQTGPPWDMPNLNLRQQEIAALVAFINADGRVGAR